MSYVRVWRGRVSGIWRWSCPECPGRLGDFHNSWSRAYAEGYFHVLLGKHEETP